MKLIYARPRFAFDGWNKKNAGWCDVRVWQDEKGELLAIAQEVINSDGSYACEGLSVTNGIEFIAAKLEKELGRPVTILIEYYPDRGYDLKRIRETGLRPQYQESFSMVAFKAPGFREPEWCHITRTEVEALIGERYE